MTDFLLLLGKLNLAMGGAIALVWLLRRPLRTQFGAPIAYALWLLVPIAGLACLLPPRVAAPLPVHVAAVQIPVAPMIAQIARPAPPAVERMPEKSATSPSVRPVIAAPATDFVMPEYATLLFAAWVLGVGAMTFYLARLQARFHAAARLGEAGPAVAGFFRPRIVIPSGFAEQFNAAEQAAILAHERAHLARQDARINALAALLRALCWFNPLVHLGAAWLRMDQELACDAAAMGEQVSRRDYANALLKSQMTLTPLPLGCDWPGSEHPLTERIALLKRKQPGPGRRIAGVWLVLFAAAFAGFGAWAAQPAVPGKTIVPPHNQVALAAAIPDQVAAPPTPSIPVDVPKPTPVIKSVSAARPVISSNPVAASKAVPVITPMTVAPPMAPVVIKQPETAITPDVQLALNAVATPTIAATPAPAAAAATAVQPATPVSSAAPPAAKQVAPNGMTPDEVVAWLQSAGYTAHVNLQAGRESSLSIDSYSSRDLMFGIYPRDCQEDRCRHLHFFSNMMLMNSLARGVLTDKQIARWNQENPSTPVTREKRMPGKEVSAPALSFDVDLPGATHDQLTGALALWNDAINRYYDFVELGTLAAPTAADIRTRPEIADPNWNRLPDDLPGGLPMSSPGATGTLQ